MADYRMVAAEKGGADVIGREEIADTPVPARGEVVVRQEAIGFNFIDTYYRSGLYPGSFPLPLGQEAAGTVAAVGVGVEGFAPGDRVGYASGAPGAYATVRAVPAEHLVRLPDGISAEVAAASLLKGMTAAYLVGPCSRIAAGDTALVHAAAGGVGSLLVPWLSAMGATVIAHAGTAEKAEQARKAGAAHSLHVPIDALADEVRELTGGKGVAVVFDGVGKASFSASLRSLARRGLLISFGNASGAVDPVAPLELMKAGSVFLTRPTLGDYAISQAERQQLADALFAVIEDGTVPVRINHRFPLAEAADAHRAVENRETTGSVILEP